MSSAAPVLSRVRYASTKARQLSKMPVRACSAGILLSRAITFFASRTNGWRYPALGGPSFQAQFDSTKSSSRLIPPRTSSETKRWPSKPSAAHRRRNPHRLQRVQPGVLLPRALTRGATAARERPVAIARAAHSNRHVGRCIPRCSSSRAGARTVASKSRDCGGCR
jgi:hypothetical protein